MSGALPLFICTIRFTSSPDSGGTGDLVRGLGTKRNRVSAIIQARLGFKCSFEKDDDGDGHCCCRLCKWVEMWFDLASSHWGRCSDQPLPHRGGL
jgi:hypothetical protein